MASKRRSRDVRRSSFGTKNVSRITAFPVARYLYPGTLQFYHAYDRMPVKDYLASCTGDNKPSILVLGCGDILSCCYTIWKNLDHSISNAPKRFHGVEFTLNDRNAAVQARNIVFLHLCLQLPETELEYKKWICAMWAIWYCHELYSDHQITLDASLGLLLKFSTSLKKWNSKENPMHHLVKFTSSTCLSDISKVWKMWYEKEIAVSSVEQMYESRNKELGQSGIVENLETYSFEYTWIALYHRQLNTEDILVGAAQFQNVVTPRQDEVKSYIESGMCFSEKVFDICLKENPHTNVNLTLYDKQDGNYRLHYESVPYNRYHQIIEFFKEYIHSFGYFNVRSESFVSTPFLANSVQQFSMWVKSTHRVLMDKSNFVSFLFNTQDCLIFCQELQQIQKSNDGREVQKVPMYNVIATSDLIDQLGPPNVILTSIPLLKDNGLLFTTTQQYKIFFNTIEEYLKDRFQCDCQMFPVIFGARCINHEDIAISSCILIRPDPPSLADLIKGATHKRELIWGKVSGAQQQTLSVLPPLDNGNITSAFLSLVLSSCFLILEEKTHISMNRINIESVLMILVRFISVSCNVTHSNFAFWGPLCKALVKVVKPYLHALQTQMLLHNIHAHLTVTESDCPLCKQIPLEKAMVLLCLKVPLDSLDNSALYFMAIIHKRPSSESSNLIKEAFADKDVHLFDCFHGVIVHNLLQISFFVPRQFVEQNFKITVTEVINMPQGGKEFRLVIPSGFLTDMQPSSAKYAFIKPDYSSSTLKGDLGDVCFHACDGRKSETKIKLSKSAIRKVSPENNIFHAGLSANEIEISCRTLSLKLKYCYPIYHSAVLMTYSSCDGELHITSLRKFNKFEEETAGFVVSPDHPLSLPPFKFDMTLVEVHTHGQYSFFEQETSNRIQDQAHLSHDLIMKRLLQSIFEGCSNNCFYFNLVGIKGNYIVGYIIVNKVLFDSERRTPVIDLAFCILKHRTNSDEVSKKWKKIVHPTKVADVISIKVDESNPEVLFKVFQYFMRYTNGSLLSAGSDSRYHILRYLNVSHLFSRAVVYFLLVDPDSPHTQVGSTHFHRPTLRLSTEVRKCEFCQQKSANEELCNGCKKVNYCSKRCQSKHWAEHHSNCTPENASKPSKNVIPRALKEKITSPSLKETETLQKACAHCKKTPDSLIKCPKCGAVEYCNEECQTNHLLEHEVCIQDCATET